MKRNILYIMMAAVCTLLMTACSTEEQAAGNATTGELKFDIADYPAFDGETTTTRADIGTYDAGKSAWAAGDEILVKVDFGTLGQKYITLERIAAGTWTQTGGNTIYSVAEPVTVTSYYAPAYQWSNGTLALKSGKTAGLDEYITFTQTVSNLQNAITVDFSQATRAYSRLRVVGETSVTMTCANFIPAGTTTALGTNTLTANVDDKGNAYFYGTWPTGSSFKLSNTVTPWHVVSQTVTSASVNAKGFALSSVAPVRIGDYYFSDGSWGTLAERPASKALAVIFDTNTGISTYKRGLAMSLIEVTSDQHWSQSAVNEVVQEYNSKTSISEVLNANDGYSKSTDVINNHKITPFNSSTYPPLCSAYQVSSHSTTPSSSSGFFLPCVGQMYKIMVNLGKMSTSYVSTSTVDNCKWSNVATGVLTNINQYLTNAKPYAARYVDLFNTSGNTGYWCSDEYVSTSGTYCAYSFYINANPGYNSISLVPLQKDTGYSYTRPIIAF